MPKGQRTRTQFPRRPGRDARASLAWILVGALAAAVLAAACGSGVGDAIRSSIGAGPSVALPTNQPSRPTIEPSRTLPTTEAPTTEAPTTEAPTTEAPTTEAPTTEPPTTGPPTTEPPTTEPPTTEPPTTEPPTTEPPSTEPTTESPTETAPSETPSVSASPVAGEEPANGWIWLLVFGILGALLILFAMRREPKGPTWQEQVLAIYSVGATYRDAVTMEVAAPAAQATPQSEARWTELDRQADELAARLHALEAAPRNEEVAAAVAQALAALGAARSATRTYRTTGQVADAETVRTRLQAFEQSIGVLRTVRG
jgi:hypothetical protein